MLPRRPRGRCTRYHQAAHAHARDCCESSLVSHTHAHVITLPSVVPSLSVGVHRRMLCIMWLTPTSLVVLASLTMLRHICVRFVPCPPPACCRCSRTRVCTGMSHERSVCSSSFRR